MTQKHKFNVFSQLAAGLKPTTLFWSNDQGPTKTHIIWNYTVECPTNLFVVEGPYLIFKVILSVIRFSFVELVQKVIVEEVVAPEPFS